MGIPPDAVVFAFVGKLIDKKRPADFVAAVTRARRAGSRLHALVIGSGPLGPATESLARDLEAPVHFAGFRNQSELPGFLAACDAVVLTSDAGETWGLVVNEAMACGLPAIVSDAAGCVRDSGRRGTDGLPVPGRRCRRARAGAPRPRARARRAGGAVHACRLREDRAVHVRRGGPGNSARAGAGGRMTVDRSTFLGISLIWLSCMALVLWGQRHKGRSSGLVISYVLQLWVLHWLGSAIYTLPWYWPPSPVLVDGVLQSTYAVAGFALGSTVLLPLFGYRPALATDPEGGARRADHWIVHTYLGLGVVMYFILAPALHNIPTLGAIASTGGNLLLVALGMECWNGLYGAGGRRSFWRWVLLTALLPFATIVTQGFLGYGFAAMLTVFSLVATFYRPRWRVVVASLVVGYLALSVYVTYMRDRREIRAVVWGQQDYSTRVSTILHTFSRLELLDLRNPDHLARIDDRLNQNFLVGAAVARLHDRPDLFARGRTVWEAAIAMIPRAIWPDRPVGAGSGDLVTEFTGIRFDRNTSVGIGHVMEWYVNFGTAGVFWGMTLIGLVVSWIDRNAAEHLWRGDWPGFVLWWLPGLSLLQVGGSFVEAASGVCTALAFALLINLARPARARQPSFDVSATVEGS